MRHPCAQRGAATLAITIVLLLVTALGAAYTNRVQLVELHGSANRLHAGEAFEAAEAGLEWGVAMLNESRPVDEQCVPTTTATTRFRERTLARVPADGAFTPITWRRDGTAVPLEAACVRAAHRWRCSCPAAAEPHVAVADIDDPAPSFRVRFDNAPTRGQVRVIATGCRGPCPASGDGGNGPTARLQVTLGFVPGLATPPAAPLTVRDDVIAGSAALGLHAGDVTGAGIAVQAGGALLAPNARLVAAPGAPSATVADHDASLHAMPADRLFAALFGLDKTVWSQQPGVARLACGGSCNDTLAQALATHRMVWVDGDLRLDGPVAVGSPARPVIVVASGALQLAGPVVIHGFVHAASVTWDDTPAGGGALLRGAIVSEAGWRGNAAPDLVHDSAVLAALKIEVGSFARLPGSWKDF